MIEKKLKLYKSRKTTKIFNDEIDTWQIVSLDYLA